MYYNIYNRKKDNMNDKKANKLVVISAIFLVLSGAVLYYIFEKQGYDNKGTSNYINYNVNDYIAVSYTHLTLPTKA